MNCSKCLKPVQESWKRCPVCKTHINATRCPLCNEILLDGWTCCPYCDNSDEELEGAVAADTWHNASELYTDDSLPLLQKSFRHDRKSRDDTCNNASEPYTDDSLPLLQKSFRHDRKSREESVTSEPETDLLDVGVAIDSREETLHNSSETENDFLRTDNQQSFGPDLKNLRDGDVARYSRTVPEGDQRKEKDEHEALTTSIVQYLKGFEDGYHQHGIERVYSLLKNDIGKWKSVPLRILVTGEAGVGKSSFINAMLGLKPRDDGAAEVGVIETTTDKKEYKHPQYQNFVLVDCPGVGTPKWPKETYLKSLNLQNCDFVIIISGSRFKENDAWLATETMKAKKKFYFVRSKIDQDIHSESENGLKSSEVVTKVENYCKQELSKLEFKNADVFIISSRFKLREQFHLKRLINTLLTDIPTLKRDALILSISLTIEPVLYEKKTILLERICKIASTAARRIFSKTNGLRILHAEIEFYQEQLGVNEERLIGFARQIDMTIDAFKKQIDLRSSIILNDPLQFREFCLRNTLSRKDIHENDHRSTLEKFFSRKNFNRFCYALYDLLMMCFEEALRILKLISTKY